MLKKRTRMILLIIAGALIVTAVVWGTVLDTGSEGRRLCDIINAHGYQITPAELYVSGSWQNSSIRALLASEEMTHAVDASLQAGFPSDIDHVGTITLIMANVSGDDVITLFLVNNDIELAFIQVTGADEVRAL